ncbi:MAG: aminotransferase class III-fold pyridoxal phosphate-dependent enzyme, partial [Nitrososphaerales archaeon]
SKRKGEYLGKRLTELKSRHRSIGDVRGLGLFWALELVKDRETKEPFFIAEDKLSRKQSVLDKVSAAAMAEGVYVLNWLSHFVVAPPLIVTKEEIDSGVDVLDKALKIADDAIS